MSDIPHSLRLQADLLRWAECQMPAWLRPKLDPADLVQQAFLDAHPPDGLDDRQMLAWYRRAVSRDLIDAARKHARAQGDVALDVLADSSLRLVEWLAGDDTSPSERASRAERFALVSAALTGLPDAQRLAVEMRYLRKSSVKEIAETLGKTEGAVAQLLHRAMEALRHVLPGA